MRATPRLLQRLHSRTASVCVVGQGYVGLSTASFVFDTRDAMGPRGQLDLVKL